jgi:dihydrofolate reductase
LHEGADGAGSQREQEATTMRNLITAMKVSVDGKFEGPQGYADWVAGWSDDYGLTPEVDACVLGAGMYRGYEPYWTQIQNHPDQVHPVTGAVPTAAEVEWADFAGRVPHYVVSSTQTSAAWPQTRFLRSLDELGTLKREQGKDIYLMGGGAITAAAIDAGLVDEIRLIVYPLIAGGEKALFTPSAIRRPLELRKAEQLPDGRLSLIYGIGSD